MGGYGSGRYRFRRSGAVESFYCLNVTLLKKASVLADGRFRIWRWAGEGQDTHAIGVHGGRERITLRYCIAINGRDWENIEECVSLIWKSCHFSGERPYFVCPGLYAGRPCNRRAIRLYLLGGRFRCRRCHGLAYNSQSESVVDRARRKAEKINRRLNPEWSDLEFVSPPPKGMWRRKYQMLKQRAEAAQNIADDAWLVKMAVFLWRQQ